jgi:hypothetical protein
MYDTNSMWVRASRNFGHESTQSCTGVSRTFLQREEWKSCLRITGISVAATRPRFPFLRPQINPARSLDHLNLGVSLSIRWRHFADCDDRPVWPFHSMGGVVVKVAR